MLLWSFLWLITVICGKFRCMLKHAGKEVPKSWFYSSGCGVVICGVKIQKYYIFHNFIYVSNHISLNKCPCTGCLFVLCFFRCVNSRRAEEKRWWGSLKSNTPWLLSLIGVQSVHDINGYMYISYSVQLRYVDILYFPVLMLPMGVRKGESGGSLVWSGGNMWPPLHDRRWISLLRASACWDCFITKSWRFWIASWSVRLL